MPVKYQHPDYTSKSQQVGALRRCLLRARCNPCGRGRYTCQRLTDQTPEEYNAYKASYSVLQRDVAHH
jgi:hypothetical protein